MVTVFVDTSGLIALLDADDSRHEEATATLHGLRSNAELVTTNYIEVETLAVVRRRLGKVAASALLDLVLPVIRVIWVDEATHAAARAEYRNAAGSASVVDRVSFAIMRREGIRHAFAFDDDFAREGFAPPPAAATDQPRRVNETQARYGENSAPDVVSVAEIAERAGRSINTVQSWRRRHRDFPAPVTQLAAGPIWSWQTIEAWIADRDNRSDRNVAALPRA